MLTLLRGVRSRGIKEVFAFLGKPKDLKVHDITQRVMSSTAKKVENTTEVPYSPKDHWVSYGFDNEDKYYDRHYMHRTMFVVVSICLVGGAWVIAYMPDPVLQDWSQREAYLQLRYREEHGLPLVDPNLIDPSKVILPTKEEIQDLEIII